MAKRALRSDSASQRCGIFGDRVADQVVVAFLAVHDEVVGVEVEAHVGREIGQPERRGLDADDVALCQQFIEALHALVLVAEGLEVEAHPERLDHALEDGLGRHAEGDQREAGELHERQVGERHRAGQAEGHRFGDLRAVVRQHGRGDAALAMRSVAVLEIFDEHVHGSCFSCSTVMPITSA